MSAGIDEHPAADAFGSMQLDATNPDLLDGAGDVCSVFGLAYRGGFGHPRQTIRGDWECFSPCAAAALYRKERFFCLSAGLMSGSFVTVKMSILVSGCAMPAGARSCLERRSSLHEGSGISGRMSDFTVYYGHRNRIWLYYKNLSLPLYVMTLPLRAVTDFLLLIRAVFAGAGAPYIRAMRDGYGGLATFNEARKTADRHRRSSGAAITGALSWSPMKLFRRGVDLRPVGNGR